MRHRFSTAIRAACLAGVALPFAASIAYPQDDSTKSKEPEKKIAETKKVDVHVKVSARDKKPLPPRSTVEVSAQESACGNLNDTTATLDDKGEATFRDLPACSVSVKINLNQYLPARKVVDLKSCAPATAAKENAEPGPAQPLCETVSLELEPL